MPGTVDSDVRIAAPSVEQLEPHLSRQWRDYIEENGFRKSLALTYSYPVWSKLHVPPEATTLEEIRARVLSRADRAVVSCYFGVEMIRHPFFASAIATAVNDWVAAEYLAKEPRLLAGVVVTPQHPDLAAEQVERAAAAHSSFVQVLLPARSWEPYGNRHYAGLVRAAADRGLALAVHYGGLSGTPTMTAGWMDMFIEEYGAATTLFQAQVASLLVEGTFETHPRLKVVLLESGWTWLPALAWKLDKEWKIFRREAPWLNRSPIESIRAHLRATLHPTDGPSDPSHLRMLLEHLGSDEMLLHSTGYPHGDGEGSEPLFAVLSAEQAARVRWTNAWETYGLEARQGRNANG